MVIDIIDFTDAQFAALSEEQILSVQEAQLKKNRLYKRLQEDFRAEKTRLVENGTFLSDIWDLYCARLQAEYDEEVTAIRNALLFYLRFASRPETGKDEYDYAYNVDYSLNMPERYTIVRSYYTVTYTNPEERVTAFLQDEVAKVYLGEYYAMLYDYLLDLART